MTCFFLVFTPEGALDRNVSFLFDPVTVRTDKQLSEDNLPLDGPKSRQIGTIFLLCCSGFGGLMVLSDVHTIFIHASRACRHHKRRRRKRATGDDGQQGSKMRPVSAMTPVEILSPEEESSLSNIAASTSTTPRK